MRFGIFSQTPGYEGSSVARRHWETVEEVVLGEELGFETAWLAESVFYPTRPMSNPLMVAIAAAQKTERIRFGTLAAQAPLHHPFHMATQAATCDILTNGRLDLCLGGRWGAPAGVPLGNPSEVLGQESRDRVAEAIELIKLAWTEEAVNFQGEYWSAENLAVLPKPVQQPHVPVQLAANSNDTFPYAAKLGLGVIGTHLSQPDFRLVDRLAEFEASKIPDAPNPQNAYVMVSLFVAETREEAHRLTNQNWLESDLQDGLALMKRMGVDPSRTDFATGAVGWQTWDFERAKEVCIYDDVSGCIERLQELQERMPTMYECILEFNRRARIPSERVQESMRLFAEKVMPALEAVSSAR